MTPSTAPRTRRGFTLIEITIALVIIALVASGIVIGQGMIAAARINRIVGDYAQFTASWTAFKTAYDAIPGDMPNATSLWDADDSCPTLPGRASNSGTCNGNGDGRINWYAAGGGGSLPALSGSLSESSLVFQHLKKAELLMTDYYPYPSASVEFPLYVFPPFRKAQRYAVWFIGTGNANYAELYPQAADPDGSSMRGVALQAATQNSNAQPRAALETPQTSYMVDTKMDDANPQTGKFQVANAHQWGTTTYLDCIAVAGSVWSYNPAVTTEACRFIYSLQQ